MYFPRRLSSPLVTIVILIGISVLVVISIGEGFKVIGGDESKDDGLMNQRSGVAWVWIKWGSAEMLQSRAVALPSPFAGMMVPIKDLASTLANRGITYPMNVAATRSKAVDPSDTTNPIAEVGSTINAAPSAGADELVLAANGAVGSLLATASPVSNIAVLADALTKSSGALASGDAGAIMMAGTSVVQSLESEAMGVTSTALPAASPVLNSIALAVSALSSLVSSMVSADASVANSLALVSPLASKTAAVEPIKTSVTSDIARVSLYPEEETPSPMSTGSPGSGSGVSNNSMAMSFRTSNETPKVSMEIMSSSTKVHNIIAGNIPISATQSSTYHSIIGTMATMSPPSQSLSFKAQSLSPSVSQSSIVPSPMPQQYTIPLPMTFPCPPPDFPAPITETRTTTETWYSTLSANTVTLYSFMDVMTIVSIVTVSECHVPSETFASSPEPSPVSCVNSPHGQFPRGAEDCHGSHKQPNIPQYIPISNSKRLQAPKYPAAPGAASFEPPYLLSSAHVLPGSSPQTNGASMTVKFPSGVSSVVEPTETTQAETLSASITCNDGTMTSERSFCKYGVAPGDIELELIKAVGPTIILAAHKQAQNLKEADPTTTAVLDAEDTLNRAVPDLLPAITHLPPRPPDLLHVGSEHLENDSEDGKSKKSNGFLDLSNLHAVANEETGENLKPKTTMLPSAPVAVFIYAAMDTNAENKKKPQVLGKVTFDESEVFVTMARRGGGYKKRNTTAKKE